MVGPTVFIGHWGLCALVSAVNNMRSMSKNNKLNVANGCAFIATIVIAIGLSYSWGSIASAAYVIALGGFLYALYVIGRAKEDLRKKVRK